MIKIRDREQTMAEAVEAPTDPESFLAWEFEQEERYERLNGVVRMMVGGTGRHNILAGNLLAALLGRLGGTDCQPFMEGMRLVTPSNDILYPDVWVVCPPFSPDATYYTRATLIAEVLSASTEGRDRGAKWQACQTVPGLRHYLLLAQDRPSVEAYHWTGEAWHYTWLEGADATLYLDTLYLDTRAITLSLAALYDSLPGRDNAPA